MATVSQSQRNHPTKLCTLSSPSKNGVLAFKELNRSQETSSLVPVILGLVHRMCPGGMQDNAGMLTGDDAPVSPAKQDMSREPGSHFKFERQGSDN